MKNILGILVTLLFIFGCSSQTEQKWQDVLRVHDEIMLQMQENGVIEQQLRALLNQSKTADSTSILFQSTDTLENLIAHLEKADEAMMDWMANLKKPASEVPFDSAMKYLEIKESEIIQVGNQMEQASTQAVSFIESLEK